MPNDLFVKYYLEQALAGLLITEATNISKEGNGWLRAPHIRTAEHAEAWKKVTDKVHEKGGVIFCQLWHAGRQSHTSFHPDTKKIIAPSAIKAVGHAHTVTGEHAEYEVPHALTIKEIKSTIQDFVKAATFAKQAGFDGVKIHSANGYLIDQFF